MKIENIDQANKSLQKYVPKVAQYTGDDYSLERMWPILEALGNPHQKLKIIHVAGTSGKTSTAYYISAILVNSGKKVGLTVSPHVDSITERFQINGEQISEKLFCKTLSEFLNIIDSVDVTLSYFELLIAYIYWLFEKEKVDYATVETGMGGLFDSTNVAQLEDKICVITDIGFDHTKFLGDKLSDISIQKAGIIHQNNQVFLYEQSSEVMNSIKDRCTEKSAKLNIIRQSNQYNLELPEYQKRNFLLAKSVVEFISKRDKFKLKKLISPNEIYIPGRMEIIEIENSVKIIMDGAHNKQKIDTFVKSFEKMFPNTKTPVLLALKKGKEYQSVVDSLLPITSNFIVTIFESIQDTNITSQSPITISNYAKSQGLDVEIFENIQQAYDRLLADQSDTKIITGSFYLLGQIRNIIDNKVRKLI